MIQKNAFTLIEIMVVISVIAVLLVGGSMVMFRTLGSRGQNQADININQAGSQIMESIEQNIRFAFVVSVGAFNRTQCQTAGVTGVTGTEVEVSDTGGSTIYNITDNRLASVSATTKYLSTSDIEITELAFTWICVAGAYDKLRVSFDLNDPVIAGEIMKRTFRRDINMYNSGI